MSILSLSFFWSRFVLFFVSKIVLCLNFLFGLNVLRFVVVGFSIGCVMWWCFCSLEVLVV